MFLTLMLSVTGVQAADICDLINIPNCPGVTKQLRRTTFPTAPSNTTAVNLNPANVSFDRGMGLDLMYQSSNPLLFSIASGTGKMGGALISGSMDNSFFGNRLPELNESLLERQENNKQFRNKKIGFALGGRLFSRKNATLDLGIIFKRHPEVKQINPGGGLSGRLWKIHFGASFYQDDSYVDLTKVIDTSTNLPYSATYQKDFLKEKFTVSTYTVGTRLGNLALDYGTIRSNLDFYGKPTNITLISGAYHFGNYLFNLALRKEKSQVPEYDDGVLVEKKNKSETYAGVQYSINKHIIFGLNYNYFLLREFSLSATLFL